MSCIVGVAYYNRIFIGGDAFGQGPACDLQNKTEPKVALNGEFLIGSSGCPRYGQVIRHLFEPPAPDKDQDLLNFMARDFVPCLQACLEENELDRSTRVEHDCASLVGYQGRLFMISPNLHVQEANDLFSRHKNDMKVAAIGSAGLIALGSLHAQMGLTRLHGGALDPRLMCTRALNAARRLSPSVSAPMEIIELRSTTIRASGKKTPKRK